MTILKNPPDPTMEPSRPTPFKRALPQVIAVLLKNILMLAFGMTRAFPTILIPRLSDLEEPFDFTTEELTWIGSINLICVPIGSILAGEITQFLGRKRSMILVNIPFMAAWLIFIFANEEWQIFLALAITGLSGGFLEAPDATYVAEIAEPRLRGMLCSATAITLTAGIPLTFLLGSFINWRSLAIAGCLVNVLSFTCLFFVPESPYWLIGKDRLQDARRSLRWLRGWTTDEATESEFKTIYREVKKSDIEENTAVYGTMSDEITSNRNRGCKKRSRLDTFKLLAKKSFLWPFSLVVIAFLLMHTTGMTTLQTYAVPVFDTLKVPIDKYYATSILGLVEFSGALSTLPLLRLAGKRLLNFVSILGTGMCFTIVGVYAYFADVDKISIRNSVTDDETYNWIPMVFLFIGAFMANSGIRILPWVLISEVFPNEIRATAAGLCGAFGYLVNFGVNKAFLNIVNGLTLHGTYWGHGIIALCGFIALYFMLPETEGKSLGQINEHFSGGAKMGNSVLREEEHATFSGQEDI